MIKFIERALKRGEHRGLFRIFLGCSAAVLRFIPAHSLKRLLTDGRMLFEYESGAPERAETVLLGFARHQAPSTWAVTSYISHVVNRGLASRLEEISRARWIEPDHRPLLQAASLRRSGDLAGALAALDYSSDEFSVRDQIVRARRSIFHQMQDHESIAVEGLRFLQAEPDAIMIAFTIGTAGSAETAKREDIFALAANRLLQDRARIFQDDALLRKHWKDAVTASLTICDLDGASEILKRAIAQKKRAAIGRLDELNALIDEVREWRPAIDAAYRNFCDRAAGIAHTYDAVDAILVVPAAALRSNSIDYEGFRADIRFFVQSIVAALEESRTTYGVGLRIRTHGELSFPVPSFSYHTISDSPMALHFKETDRPSRFSFDTGGYAGWSDFSTRSAEDLELGRVDQIAATAFFRGEQDAIIGGNISKYTQADQDTDEALPEKFVFVGLQIIGDAVQRLAYQTPFQMMDEVIDTCLQQGLSVVVKRHPQCKSAQIADYLQARAAQGEIMVSTGSIHTLIAGSEAVCVVNSGVGGEALLHEKPVYVFGRADYMQACFVCQEPGDFRRQFVPGQSRLSIPDLHRFWHLLRNVYAVDLRDRADARGWIARRVQAHLERNRREDSAA